MTRRAMLLATVLIVLASCSARIATAAGPTCSFIYYGAISYCTYGDGSVSVENRSFSVIDVSRVLTSTGMSILGQRSQSLDEQAAAAAAPARCFASGVCTLAPGRRLVAVDRVAFPLLSFDFDLRRSVARNAALTLVGMLEKRLYSPGRRLAEVVGACATHVGSLARRPSQWQAALRQAIGAYGSCKAVVKALGQDPAEEDRAAANAVGAAKSLLKGMWIDEMFELFGRVLRR